MKKNAIKTKAVFTEDDQVYLKKDNNHSSEEKWFPINFQWVPVLELQKK